MKRKRRPRLSNQAANRQEFRMQIKVDGIEQKDCKNSKNKKKLFSKPVTENDECKQIRCGTLKTSIRTSVYRRNIFCN